MALTFTLGHDVLTILFQSLQKLSLKCFQSKITDVAFLENDLLCGLFIG